MSEDTSSESKKFWLQNIDIIGGLLAVLCWIVVFASGAVVETLPSRIAIGPVSTLKSLDADTLKAVYHLTQTDPLPARIPSSDVEGYKQGLIKWSSNLQLLPQMKHFLICVFCYTPINLAVLSFLAGMMGGYFSNFYARNLRKRGIAIKEEDQLRFLEEPPLTSAMRGFLAYICFIAGIYIVVDSPFEDTSTKQYLKIAGSISAVAFLFGYDPTRIGQLFALIPLPANPSGEIKGGGGKKSTEPST